MKEIILKTIEEHGQSVRNWRCSCGWRPTYPQDIHGWESTQHDAHLADVLAAALLPAMTAATLSNATITPCDPETYARGHNDGYEAAITQGIADDPTRADEWLQERIDAALKPATELVELAENRKGALYCHVTTYELRHALGMDTDDWPPCKR